MMMTHTHTPTFFILWGRGKGEEEQGFHSCTAKLTYTVHNSELVGQYSRYIDGIR